MPRQVRLKKKIEWTDLADSGLSIPEIRCQDPRKPDPRTIKKAIDQIRGQRRRTMAKEVALQQGLREHWNLLLAKLDLLPAPDFDWTDFDKDPVFALRASSLSGRGWSATQGQEDWTVSLGFEGTIEYELLHEHLPSDSFWSLMNMFKRDLGAAIGARITLAGNLVTTVAESARLAVTKQETERGLELAGLSRLYQLLEAQALRDGTSKLALKVVDGTVWFENTLLVKSPTVKSDSLVKTLEDTFNNLRGNDEWRALLAKAAKVERTVKTLANEAAVLRLSTVLPGECRSCARYSV